MNAEVETRQSEFPSAARGAVAAREGSLRCGKALKLSNATNNKAQRAFPGECGPTVTTAMPRSPSLSSFESGAEGDESPSLARDEVAALCERFQCEEFESS